MIRGIGTDHLYLCAFPFLYSLKKVRSLDAGRRKTKRLFRHAVGAAEKAQKEKGKSLIETMREIDAKEAQKEAEAEERRQEILAEREKKKKRHTPKKSSRTASN